MFRIQNTKGETIASSITKYYSWDILKNQLIFGTRIIDGRLFSLNLTRLQDLAATHRGPLPEPTIAIELAFNLIDQRFRRKGLGATMFETRITRALDIETKTPKFAFTMARGAYLDQGIGNQIFKYALQREAEVNGYDEAGKVNIGGLEISVEDIQEQLALPESLQLDQVHEDSQPIPKLAKKFGFVYIGLFKDLSPVFATAMR
jgi:GNAT superfamily N-acetyltransferase